MAYVKQNWENLPLRTTALEAERLNHLETQYDEAVAYTDVSVQQIIDNSIEAQDPVVAALLDTPASQTRKALDNTTKVFVNVNEFGADPTGVADSTSAFNSAATRAEMVGGVLYVPDGEYVISDTVTTRTDIECNGLILVDAASNGNILALTKTPPTELPVAPVVGLTAGSGSLSNVPEGVLVIRSDELLINRFDVSGVYTKNEVVQVFADGTIFPPLEHTYNKSLITHLTLYAPGSACDVSGVNIGVIGTGSRSRYLTVYGSHNTVRDCEVSNNTGAPLDIAISLVDSHSTTLENVSAHGFNQSGGGYGVLLTRSANTIFNNPNITNCRHAIAGRHNRGVVVNGGVLHNGFDTHWGGDIVLNNVTSILNTPVTNSHVLIAGKGDVTVNGGKFYGGRQLVSLRLDTPTLDGNVRINPLEWFPAHNISGDSSLRRALFGYSAFDDAWGAFDFDYPMKSPSVHINNPTVHVTGRDLCGVHIPLTSFPRSWGAQYNINGITLEGDTPTSVFPFYAIENGTPEVADVYVNVNGKCVTTTGYSFDTGFSGGGDPSATYHVKITDETTRTRVRLSHTKVVAHIEFIRCVVGSINRNGLDPENGSSFKLIDSTTEDIYINGRITIDCINTLWTGSSSVGAGGIPINERIRSFIGCTKEIGQTGAPTLTDGYRNPLFYEV